jgi:hypothetical protein
MHAKDELFHGKRRLAVVDAQLLAGAVEKLILAEVYLDDGAAVTAFARLRNGMHLLEQAMLSAPEAQSVPQVPTEDLRNQLDAAVRCACAMRDELTRRGIELAIDLKEGVVLPLKRAVSAGGSR